MNNPSPSFLTKQIINRVVALYLHEHPDCSIDDLVIAAATPAIHTQFSDYHLLAQDFIYAIGFMPLVFTLLTST